MQQCANEIACSTEELVTGVLQLTVNPNQAQNSFIMPKVVDICSLASRGPYAPQAYAFVQDGLRFTAQQLFSQSEQTDPQDEQMHQNTHVSGRELSIGLGNFAIERYGLLAHRVLQHWNVHRTDDFGRIVFRMIDSGLLSSQEEDSIEDFFGIYDFEEHFQPERVIAIIAQDANQGTNTKNDDGSNSGSQALAGSSS